VIVQGGPPGLGEAVTPVTWTLAGMVSAITTFWASDGPWLVDVMVQWMGAPATTGEVPSTFVVTIAAEVVTVPPTAGLVHAPVKVASHAVSEVMVAEFSTDAPDGVEATTVPRILTDASVPFGTVGNVQETSLPVTVQDPASSGTIVVMPDTFAGTVSSITTLVASDGPWLVEVTVHWMALPATTGSVSRLFVLTSAARPAAVADAVQAAEPGQLFVFTGSAVALVTVNEFDTVDPAAVGDTRPTSDTTADCAAARVGNKHDTV